MSSKDNKTGTSGLIRTEPLLWEHSRHDRQAYSICESFGDIHEVAKSIPENLLRIQSPELPELDEPTVTRHFTRLSTWNHGLDSGMYPLGSCTMKYNPRINEQTARLKGFAGLHPYAPEKLSQGALQLMFELAQYLAEISGFAQVTLQPAAGAQGELTGIKIIRAYHKDRGDARKKVLVPDTAHGTNPASSHLSGYKVIEIPSGPAGILEPEAVEKATDDQVAALMVTNPNTLGLFERNISKIADILHAKGALLYCDGANLNSLMGIARPGDMGIDVMQFNLHKTFSTPHGGGGPGSGPVGVAERLIPFLPTPLVTFDGDTYSLDHDRPKSIGKVKAFYGNFAIMVRAYTYIREMGAQGLKLATEMAVLNANYVRARLEDTFDLPYKERSLHEVVFSDKHLEQFGVTTLDVAKRLIDHGFHPPTVYFPLVVHGSIMIEPTETESKETLDEFIQALKSIDEEARTNPDELHAAPSLTHIGRLDEVKAARNPVLTYRQLWDEHKDPQ